MIQVRNLSHEFGDKTLFNSLSFSVEPGKSINIFGPNGAGKSTLLKILANEIQPSSGQLFTSKDTSIGYLSQDPKRPEKETSVFDYILSGLKDYQNALLELKRLEDKIDQNPDDKTLEKYSDLQTHFFSEVEPEAKSRTDLAIKGIGIESHFINQDVRSLSGGEFIKVELAKILSAKPDLLLLDEPTNHLDIVARKWFLDFVKNYEGGIVLISHDRSFSEKACNQTVFVEPQYSKFIPLPLKKAEERRSEELDRLKKEQANQQKKIEEVQRFITRFSAKATKARQANSRKKMLEKLKEELEETKSGQVESNKSVQSFAFKIGKPSPPIPFKTEDLSIGYGSKILSRVHDLSIVKGDKVALVGPNGVGKTTFLKTLLGEIASVEGKVEKDERVEIGVFHQNAGANLKFDGDCIDYLFEHSEGSSFFQLRSILGGFLFDDQTCENQVEKLSGGEKNRLLLSRMMLSEYNVLVLDEPTNHLDVFSIDALTNAIKNYSGTVIFVSHDQSFVDQACDKVLAWTEKGVELFHGNLAQNETKIVWQKTREQNIKHEAPKIEPVSEQETKQVKKKKINPIKLALIEKSIEELEAEIEELNFRVQELYSENSFAEAQELNGKLDQKNEQLDRLMTEWEESQDE